MGNYCDSCGTPGSTDDDAGYTAGEGYRCVECRENVTSNNKRSNNERATLGSLAINSDLDRDGDNHTALVDLLANLRHWADRHAPTVDFNAAVETSAMHHNDEVMEVMEVMEDDDDEHLMNRETTIELSKRRNQYPTYAVPRLWLENDLGDRQIGNPRGSIYAVGDTIYSFGSHFPIARKLPSGVVLITTRDYSRTTAKHICAVRAAIEQAGKTMVDLHPALWDEAAAKRTGEIRVYFRDMLADLLRELAEARNTRVFGARYEAVSDLRRRYVDTMLDLGLSSKPFTRTLPVSFFT